METNDDAATLREIRRLKAEWDEAAEAESAAWAAWITEKHEAAFYACQRETAEALARLLAACGGTEDD